MKSILKPFKHQTIHKHKALFRKSQYISIMSDPLDKCLMLRKEATLSSKNENDQGLAHKLILQQQV